jgi:hypothetical protein
MDQSLIHTTMARNTEDKSNNATDSSASSPFMKLAPELRNTIYEYDLQLPNDGVFQVSETEPIREPPLLLTCKTIRSEAIAIFYAQNSILLTVDSCSPAMPLFIYKKELALFAQYKCKIKIWSVWLRGPPRWKNFLAWLRHSHECVYVDVPLVRVQPPLGPGRHHPGVVDQWKEWMVIAGLQQMVDLMDDAEWDDVEETLNILRYGLVKINPEWDVD